MHLYVLLKSIGSDVMKISTEFQPRMSLKTIDSTPFLNTYSSYSFTTSALDGGEWSASRPCRALPPGKGPPVPIVQEAGWVPCVSIYSYICMFHSACVLGSVCSSKDLYVVTHKLCHMHEMFHWMSTM
jgi:hypothetical protein